MTTKEKLSNAANLHWAAFQMTGSEHHYQMALQYQKWTQEAGDKPRTTHARRTHRLLDLPLQTTS